jgi:hypothetical protein
LSNYNLDWPTTLLCRTVPAADEGKKDDACCANKE